MIKSEKLAMLVRLCKPPGPRTMCDNEYNLIRVIWQAHRDYEAAPDDPPQTPEMPECVRVLCVLGKDSEASVGQLEDAVCDVERHYRQPLKLEVGKCYEDAGGNVVSIVWQDPKFASHLVGVVRLTGEPRRYSKEGSCCDPNCEGIIREVKR